MLTEANILLYSNTLKNGGTVENPKIELKREWWDFDYNEGQEEFAKDISALANTMGGDSHIIIGLDEKGELYNTPYPNGKYNDPSKLLGLIFKKVQEPLNIEFYEIQIENKNIVVIEIPKSYNKPHIIKQFKKYQNYIPIRKSTSIYPADKFDLDLMYSERDKNVTPPYRLEIFLSKPTYLSTSGKHSEKMRMNCLLNILNTGERINMLTQGSFVILVDGQDSFNLELSSFFEPQTDNGFHELQNGEYPKVHSNDIKRFNLSFSFENEIQYLDFMSKINSNILEGYISITDVSGILSTSDTVPLLFK